MDSAAFKYKHQYQQQNQHFNKSNNNNTNINNSSSISNNHHNNNNHNSIFILNTTTHNILPNNSKPYYTDFNDNNVVSSSSSFSPVSTATNTASSSVWSSASSTMCSPAAHAIQKLFNCSSNSLKLNQHGNYSGIESKTFKSKSEILKKKTKFWKYLEGEANDKTNQRGIDDIDDTNQKKEPGKSQKYKSKYWSKSYESHNQNQRDLSELLEYSCSLCDNCRCMDCQIGYFDCENSDDSNSEYSFHMSAYEEDDDNAAPSDHENLELRTQIHNCLIATCDSCCNGIDNKPTTNKHFQIDSKKSPKCTVAYCVCNELNCTKAKCCQQCFIERIDAGEEEEEESKNIQDFITTRDH